MSVVHPQCILVLTLNTFWYLPSIHLQWPTVVETGSTVISAKRQINPKSLLVAWEHSVMLINGAQQQLIRMGNNYSRKVQTVQQQLGLEPLPEHYLLQPGTSVYRNSQQTQSPHANCLQTCSLTHYLVLLNKEHLPAYKRSYQFRQSHPDRLIQIVHGSIRVCGDDYCKLDLYLQSISLTLDQLLTVHFDDMLSILYQSLLGLRLLFEFAGSFQVDAKMIGFNEQAMTKVWFNEKHTKYSCKPHYEYEHHKDPEGSMVLQLHRLFWNKVDRSTVPQYYPLTNTRHTFRDYIDSIKDYISGQDQIQGVQETGMSEERLLAPIRWVARIFEGIGNSGENEADSGCSSAVSKYPVGAGKSSSVEKVGIKGTLKSNPTHSTAQVQGNYELKYGNQGTQHQPRVDSKDKKTQMAAKSSQLIQFNYSSPVAIGNTRISFNQRGTYSSFRGNREVSERPFGSSSPHTNRIAFTSFSLTKE